MSLDALRHSSPAAPSACAGGRRRAMARRRARMKVGAFVAGSAIVGWLGGCAPDLPETPRPVRGSIGVELFGVICDRVGAQALPEDLTGQSFKGVCHKDAGG